MYEAAKREKKLKARIQELMETLETLSKNSEVRHQQTAEYVADLKKANGALVAAYEKAKKKHGARLRKLEQQMIALVERHDKQVGTVSFFSVGRWVPRTRGGVAILQPPRIYGTQPTGRKRTQTTIR